MRGWYSFSAFLAALPLRWRLALVSFGLLALLLILLGFVISSTEEQTLLTSQADVLWNEARIAQMQFQANKFQLTEQQILTFPEMSQGLSATYASALHTTFGQSVGVSLLTFHGNVLATDESTTSGSSGVDTPAVTVAQSAVQSWLSGHASDETYLLANDVHGQRVLVILIPIAGWDKSVTILRGGISGDDLSGYRKALLQLSVSTAAIDQAIVSTRLMLTFGILIALGLAGALTLPLINLALRPLVEMERVSSLIAAGALDQRLTEPLARDEIGRLARTFNHMVARLETAFERQKHFVADVSHELRTPLTGLGGSLEMLLLGADNGDEATAHRLISGMYSEVERMQRLVADLLALARLDEGQLKLHVAEIKIEPFIEALVCQVQSMVDGQTFTYQVSSSLGSCRADGDQLRRILLNVLENACKFTPAGGHIELKVDQESDTSIAIEVKDTGIGIALQDLPHVFERFYRADASRTRLSSQIGGSGLGLSLARELAEAHGGTISISSVPGEGTTVTLILPMYSKVSSDVPEL